ncbi:F-box only protein 17 isoform X5 [Gorilla gorilla gorilla]|uniref:F-box only protein 17 isoform X5 n=1 Tax=Gorilla gorilla gorilla TaxID=9595 RepID=UPI00244619A3|nr:F-box only protein 17 isoform X1 [Gorilla gorilla gorilla]XP_055225299.1 F-box only protein 17 isoform X1 [Gorilla gorilla gorilla]XP_055225300.1 F-box only protein 17 isoform X1 [Gorilla gorilla gorilla]
MWNSHTQRRWLYQGWAPDPRGAGLAQLPAGLAAAGPPPRCTQPSQLPRPPSLPLGPAAGGGAACRPRPLDLRVAAPGAGLQPPRPGRGPTAQTAGPGAPWATPITGSPPTASQSKVGKGSLARRCRLRAARQISSCPSTICRKESFSQENPTLAAGDGRPAIAATAAGGPVPGPGRAAPGAAGAGAEPRAATLLGHAMPPSVPRLARHSGRAHCVAAAAGPRPQRRGPRTLRSGSTLPAQQRRQGGVPAVRSGALLSARALRPQSHLQLLRRAGLQRLGGGAWRERLGHRKEPNTGAWGSFADLLRDLFRMVLQEAACGPGDGRGVAGAAGQCPD